MKHLMLEPTAAAQWKTLVSEAESACHRDLGAELQSYLVFMLMRFAVRPELAAAVIATEYLRGTQSAGGVRAARLRDVGDQCLLYSGLFPHRAERKLVRVSYFVEMGRSAYGELAHSLVRHGADMYIRLSAAFVVLMEVLQAMRALGGTPLGPLHGLELWHDTGSRYALQELTSVSDKTPVRSDAAMADTLYPRQKSH